MHEEWLQGRRGFYICGREGYYAVKACGNNRILARDLQTLEDARNWLTEYYPGAIIQTLRQTQGVNYA